MLSTCMIMDKVRSVFTWLIFLMVVKNGLQLQVDKKSSTTPETWTGRWLPERKTLSTPHADIYDSQHGVKMGIITDTCDDAKTNLTLDWNNSPMNYTCYDTSNKYHPNWDMRPIIEFENIPKYYSAEHRCMDQPIYYTSAVPTFGTHRPLWPQYGEYKFVPIQRWLHTLEHGGIVMLYHPCANTALVKQLRKLVTNCLRRHVITPHTLLDSARPLALVAWGVRLTMSTVDDNIVENFIKAHALRGPEQVSREGQYQYLRLNPAAVVSDFDDTILCPRKK